jgi:hypothetical protein
MRMVLVFSGLHTDPEHENGFSFAVCVGTAEPEFVKI